MAPKTVKKVEECNENGDDPVKPPAAPKSTRVRLPRKVNPVTKNAGEPSGAEEPGSPSKAGPTDTKAKPSRAPRKPRAKKPSINEDGTPKPKKPRKPRTAKPKTNRKVTGDGGGGPNANSTESTGTEDTDPPPKRKRGPAKPKPVLLDEYGNIIKRGRGRPRGSRGTTYRRRKPLNTGTVDGVSTIGTEVGTFRSGFSSRRGGGRGSRGGRSRGGRGRGRGGRGGGIGSVQAAKERNRVLRELMQMEEEEESEEDIGAGDVPEVDFDPEDILVKMYDSRGVLLRDVEEAAVPAFSARCPWSAPFSSKKNLDVGRRGRKRRLAVEKEEVVPVQALFKKGTRLSLGMGSLDHEFKMIAQTRNAILEHRKAAANFALYGKVNIKKEEVVQPSDTNNREVELRHLPGIQIRLEILEAVDKLRREVLAYFIHNSRSFSTSTMFKAIQTLVFNTYQRMFQPLKELFPDDQERHGHIFQLMLDIIYRIYQDITDIKDILVDFRFTVIEVMEDITIAEAEKNMQIDLIEIFNVSGDIRKPQCMDESCIWGLKPLRMAFAPPYFKVHDGFVAAPALFELSSFDRSCIFPLGNQKWTPRDMSQLRLSIREAVVERKTREIDLKHEELMNECYEVRDRACYLARLKASKLNGNPDEEMRELPPPPKKRGRPKKDPIYAHIIPHLADIKMDKDFAKKIGFYEENPKIVVRYCINNLHVRDWRNKQLDFHNKLKFEHIAVQPDLMKLVDWEAVSSKLMLVTKKVRTMHDCRLAFEHNVDPKLKRRWNAADTAHLNNVLKGNPGLSWREVADTFNGTKTEFTCFFRWRSQKDAEKRIKWNDAKDEELLKLAIQFRGNWKKVAAELGESKATKNNVIERYKKKVNPILRNGAFDKVEDSLLLLALEKLKGHMNREGHFGELTAYLPWRFESTWRDRAGNVFADWVVPWTLEEDRRLIGFVQTMRRSWKNIATMFNSFKNRKGCLTRYKILEKGLEKFGSLEAYHETYAMTRYNTFQCVHLDRVLELLKQVLRQPLVPFAGLDPRRPPNNDELQSLLLSYNKTIVASTIQSIEKYLENRNNQWIEWIELHGKRQRTFDRRTFHPENPQSVASALHIRGILLKPKSDCTNLTPFQSSVFMHYARFTRTKPLKKDATRRYLPTGTQLTELDEIKDIIYGFDPDRCPTPPPGPQERGGRWKRKLGPTDRNNEPEAKRRARGGSRSLSRGRGTGAGRGRSSSRRGTGRGGGTRGRRSIPARRSTTRRKIEESDSNAEDETDMDMATVTEGEGSDTDME